VVLADDHALHLADRLGEFACGVGIGAAVGRRAGLPRVGLLWMWLGLRGGRLAG
jgi:hypothetical protein